MKQNLFSRAAIGLRVILLVAIMAAIFVIPSAAVFASDTVPAQTGDLTIPAATEPAPAQPATSPAAQPAAPAAPVVTANPFAALQFNMNVLIAVILMAIAFGLSFTKLGDDPGIRRRIYAVAIAIGVCLWLGVPWDILIAIVVTGVVVTLIHRFKK